MPQMALCQMEDELQVAAARDRNRPWHLRHLLATEHCSTRTTSAATFQILINQLQILTPNGIVLSPQHMRLQHSIASTCACKAAHYLKCAAGRSDGCAATGALPLRTMRAAVASVARLQGCAASCASTHATTSAHPAAQPMKA